MRGNGKSAEEEEGILGVGSRKTRQGGDPGVTLYTDQKAHLPIACSPTIIMGMLFVINPY